MYWEPTKLGFYIKPCDSNFIILDSLLNFLRYNEDTMRCVDAKQTIFNTEEIHTTRCDDRILYESCLRFIDVVWLLCLVIIIKMLLVFSMTLRYESYWPAQHIDSSMTFQYNMMFRNVKIMWNYWHNLSQLTLQWFLINKKKYYILVSVYVLEYILYHRSIITIAKRTTRFES